MIFTAGHSTHDLATFAAICRGTGSTPPRRVIDVRSHPTSRLEQFRRENLEQDLPLHYEWMPALGGWDKRHEPLAEQFKPYGVDVHAYTRGVFPKNRIGGDRPKFWKVPYDERPNEWWNQGLYDYSWYTTLPEWLDACDDLIGRFNRPGVHCVIFCAEARWDKCHRQMIADYLENVCAVPVYHLKAFVPKRPTTARFTRHGQDSERFTRYAPKIRDVWESRP